ncbi:MAG: hypothetical protein ACRDMV_13885 [Streptosporangiales bacterium]
MPTTRPEGGCGDDMEHSEGDPQQAVRFFLRPLGNPLPLGFVGLAGGTLALAGMQLGWVPTAQSHQVALAILLIAVPLQFISSVLGFLSRDPVAGTGMGTLAVAWLTTSVLTFLSPPGSRSAVLGLVLFYLAAAVLVSAVIAASGKALAGLVLAVATARFAVTGVYEYFGGTGWMYTAGWLGLALCVIALYAVLAFELEGIQAKTVLPTLRRGLGRRAMTSEGLTPIGPVEHEAGIRQQL